MYATLLTLRGLLFPDLPLIPSFSLCFFRIIIIREVYHSHHAWANGVAGHGMAGLRPQMQFPYIWNCLTSAKYIF